MEKATLEGTPKAARSTTPVYACCIEASRRARRDIDRDVIRGRRLEFDRKFLPDALSKVDELAFLEPAEKRFLSQVQGRTYANIFGLVERFIGAKALDPAHDHGLGDQVALEAPVRMTGEELRHQELFGRLATMAAAGMPSGYRFLPRPDAVAAAVLGKSSWAVLGLALDIEAFTQVHYRTSIATDEGLSTLWRDVFRFHRDEESRHAILHELEWRREDARLDDMQRERAVTDLIELVAAVDGILGMQAEADADYFLARAGRTFSSSESNAVHDVVLKAYRWQYIGSGVRAQRFVEVLADLVSSRQMDRIGQAVAPILAHIGI